MNTHAFSEPFSPLFAGPVDFLWLELTNRCNLQCIHCYAESGPEAGASDILSCADYARILEEAYALGCRRVQFIGGEPTLNRDLEKLIVHADDTGFEFIEVFTNLTRLPKTLLKLLTERRVNIATSIYASTAGVHDRVTTISGSFARTIANLKQLIAAGISVRAGVIEMTQNQGTTEETIHFLKSLGVQSIGSDKLRKFGRGDAACGSDMGELCGQCAGPRLCVAPDGRVSPCIMSKAWSVGSVQQDTLANIVQSEELRLVRSRIAEATRIPATTGCTPDRPHPCGPDYGTPCGPCNPNIRCGPNACRPV